jgi:hypothetical protein
MVLDPVTAIGVVASGFQLGTEAFAVATCLVKYCKDLADAPSECKALRNELCYLSTALFHVADTYADGDMPRQLKDEFIALGPLIQGMLSKTDKRQTEGFLRLAWPFTKKKTKECLEKIKGSKDRIDTLLNSENQ